MEEMDKILAMGYNFSLSPWWFENNTTEKDFEKMRERIKKSNDWIKRMRILWNWDNLLYINGARRPSDIDLFQLRRDLEMRRYARPKPQYYDTDAYRAAVNVYEPLVRRLLNSGKSTKTQQQYLREKLGRPKQTSNRHEKLDICERLGYIYRECLESSALAARGKIGPVLY